MSFKIEVKSYLDKQKMLELSKKCGKSGAQEQAERMCKELKETSPVDTGKLKNSFSVSESQSGYQVTSASPYVWYVNAMPQSSLKNGGKAHFVTQVVNKYSKGGGSGEL